MDFNSLLIKNSAGKPSLTTTAFIIGFLVLNFKLIFSGMSLGTLTLSAFSGTDYAAGIAALGGVYWARRKDEDKLANKEGE